MDLLITELKADKDGGVVQVCWMYSYKDSGFESSYSSLTNLIPNHSDIDYIEYNSLKEDNVKEWVKSALGEEKINEIHKYLRQRVEKHKRLAKGAHLLPWS